MDGNLGGPADPLNERIVRAALSCFEDQGLKRTTMEDVARRARTSRITVYRRFSTKDRLIRAAITHELLTFFTALDSAVGAAPDADHRIAEGFAFAVTYLRQSPLVGGVLASEPEALLPYLTTGAGPLLEMASSILAARLQTEVDRGTLPAMDVTVAAELLARLSLSFVLTPQSVVRTDSPEEARRFALRFLAPALRSQRPPASAG